MLLMLPFNDFKVNMYNYTVWNKLKEIRIVKRVNQKRRRPENNFKQQDAIENT